MPEGDTLHSIANALRPRLLGRRLLRVYLRERGELSQLRGRQVQRVEAYGKHLLILLDSDAGLRVHLGMHGRVRRHASPPRSPALPLVIATAGEAFSFPRASQVELFRGPPERVRALSELGPDLSREQVDFEAVIRRARDSRHHSRSLSELLLDQRVAAGVGNVIKSEALFRARLSPFAPVGSVTPEQLRALYRTAARLLHQNGRGGRRVTVDRPGVRSARPGPALWVYGRAGEACFECSHAVAFRRQGAGARGTYYCAHCQNAR